MTVKHDSSHDSDGNAPLEIIENIQSHAIFTLDTKGSILTWNRGAEVICGQKRTEAIGRPFDIIYTSSDQKAGKPKKDLDYAKKKGSFQDESHKITNNGDVISADLSITPMLKNKKLNGFVVVAKDTTQRKKDEVEQIDANTLLRQEIDRRKAIEKALKESNEELDAFASAAGHDLQEPLRMVVSYLQLIEKRYSEIFDQDGRDFLDFAIDGATRMKNLISDLVEYSRIETLGKPLKPTDSNAVLENVLSSLEVYVREKKATITHDTLPEIWSDEVQLNELLQNLIANAIKFGAKGNNKKLKIHIGVTEKPDEYIFSISDNGPGIEKKDFKTIFLIFKQLGGRLHREGSGVGLAICKKIVKRHKGRIWVESTVGKGSTFYFSIPRVKEQT